MASSNTVLGPSRTTRHHTRILSSGTSRDSSSPYPDEAYPVVILRVQILSCHNLEPKDRNGHSDPCVRLPLVLFRALLNRPSPPHRSSRSCSFVIVSVFGKRFQTPVCKRELNPVYEAKDATFDFPFYTSLVFKLGTLKFVVWDKDIIRNNYLGEHSLPIDHWVKGTTLPFDDPGNEVRHSLLPKIRVGALPPFSALIC